MPLGRNRFNRFWKKTQRSNRFNKRRNGMRNGMGVKAIKNIVKKAISRNIETKHHQFYDTDVDITGVANTDWSTTIIPVSPYSAFNEITQGVGSGNRIGNRIKIKNCTIKGTIVTKGVVEVTNPFPQPTYIVIWVFYDKSEPTSIPDPVNDFFELNNSTASMTGTLQDLHAPINRDRYVLYTKRIFKLGNANYEGTGASSDQNFRANNDFKLTQDFSINLTKGLIKTVKFQDNIGIPMTRGLYMAIEAIPASGVAYGAAIRPMDYFYRLDVTYEDA